MVASLDAFVEKLGNPGRFQVIAFLFLWGNTFPLAFNNLSMFFFGAAPRHHCKLPENNTGIINDYIPTVINDKGTEQLSSCQMYKDPQDHSLGTTYCPNGWSYTYQNYPQREWTIVAEWDLVCELKGQASVSASIYFFGVMIGGFVGGWLAGIIGRRPVILACIYLQLALGIGVAYIDNFVGFTTIRFFQAILLQALQTCSFTVSMELFRLKERTVTGIVMGMAWSIALIVLALIAYGLGNWRYIQLAITLPSIISLGFFWFTPESFRWLMTQQKTEQAEQLVRKITKFNRLYLDEDVKNQLQKISQDCQPTSTADVKYGILDLFRTPAIRKRTIITCILWFAISLVYYTLSFGITKLGGNFYFSFVISGCIELPVRACMIYILNRFGRRNPIAFCLVAAGLLNIIPPLILEHTSGEISGAYYVAVSAAIIGKAFVGASFPSIGIYTIELFPTVVRTLASGLSTLANRVGGVVAPQVAELANLTWRPTPNLICGGIGIASGLLILILPDTLNMSMPDTIEDAEEKLEDKEKKTKTKESETERGKVNAAFEISEIPAINGAEQQLHDSSQAKSASDDNDEKPLELNGEISNIENYSELASEANGTITVPETSHL